ncbi:MAG: hypothetical protein WBH99_09470 [Azovibrio sp.]
MNRYAEVFIACNQYSVSDGTISSKVDEIGDNQGIDTFLLASTI